MNTIAFKILGPEEAKKRAKANVAEWERQKLIEEKRAELEAKEKKVSSGPEEKKAEPKPKRKKPGKTIGGKRQKWDWSSMDDAELIQFANKIIDQTGKRSQMDLAKSDTSLYIMLKKRGLLKEIKLEDRRKINLQNDEDLLQHARDLMERNGLTQNDLMKYDPGLFMMLKNRRLLDRL